MKRIFILLALTALCGLLSSCSHKPISGQVSVVTQGGANVTLGAVQIEVISARDADDFMSQCQAEIDSKTRAFKTAYNNAKTARDAAARGQSKAELARAEKELNVTESALKNFPTANDYFEGFMPSPIETTMADVEGDFTIESPKQPAKVFAKAQRQAMGSVENYYWLVDLPAAGDKLILSNTNMFTAPRQSLP